MYGQESEMLVSGLHLAVDVKYIICLSDMLFHSSVKKRYQNI